MQRSILTLILVTTAYLSFSQTTTIRKSDKQFSVPGNDFAFIEPKTDTAQLEFVATIQSTAKNKTGISQAFFAILDQAKNYGANCFKLSSYNRSDSSGDVTLILDTYFGNDSILNINFGNHEETAVFVYGDENTNGNETYSFKVNGDKKTIRSGTYYKQIIKPGEEIKINKGGITGMTMWFTYRPGSKATFLTLTGLGLGGGPVPSDMIGVSFNTGRLNHVPGDLGCLLKHILKQSE
ncbi:MAG: hypothetical protein ABI685_06830 [Ferruginibacter sp.]